jgi:hypothetical protein
MKNFFEEYGVAALVGVIGFVVGAVSGVAATNARNTHEYAEINAEYKDSDEDSE